MSKFEWRESQIRAANKILCQFQELDNVVLNGPTGSGKSGIGYAIHDLCLKENPTNKTLLLCHQKVLQDQYSDFLEGIPGVMVLKGKSNYNCALIPGKTVDAAPCQFTNKCRFKESCEYWKRRQKIPNIPLLITNYQMVLSLMETKGGWNRKTNILICDECFVSSQKVLTEDGSISFTDLYKLYANNSNLPRVWSQNDDGKLELKNIRKVWKTSNNIVTDIPLIKAINICKKIINNGNELNEYNYNIYKGRAKGLIKWNTLVDKLSLDQIVNIINNRNVKKKFVNIKAGKFNIICSSDHLILTVNGWQQAGAIQIGDILLGKNEKSGASVTPLLNDDQYQILLGSFLGDGGVRYNSQHKSNVGRLRLRCNHGDKQERYLRWKAGMFDCNVNIGQSGYSSRPIYRFTTRNIDIANKFPSKKHDCPEWVMDQLDARGLAIWFMDDGSCQKYSITFNVQSFSYEAIEMIKRKMLDKWDISLDIRPEKGRYYILVGNKEAHDKLFSIIGEYINVEMPASKLKWFNNIGQYKWNNSCVDNGSASVLSINEVPYNSYYYKSSLYDLEVEDNHNYVVCGSNKTGGVVVHNSHNIPTIVTDYRRLTASTGEISSYNKAIKTFEKYNQDGLVEICNAAVDVLKTIPGLSINKPAKLTEVTRLLTDCRRCLVDAIGTVIEDSNSLLYDNTFMTAVSNIYDRDSRYVNKYLTTVASEVEHVWDVKSMDEYTTISLTPLEAHEITSPILSSLGDKRIFMSATVFRDHAKTLGLDNSVYIQLPNNIPVENRPVIFNPVINMNASTANPKSADFIDLCDTIVAIIGEHKGESGIVFTPSYNLAGMIRGAIESRMNKLGYHILINYDANGRNDVLETFRTMKTKNKILISPSFSEGVNFEYDIARFGVITKAPFMSLGDNYVKVKMKKDKRWYELEALTQLIQMCYSEDTEILTTNGWQRYDSIKVGDICYGLHPDLFEGVSNRSTGSAPHLIENEITNVIINDYNGKMVRVNTRSSDVLVTPEHTMCIIPHSQALKAKKYSNSNGMDNRCYGISYGIKRVAADELYKMGGRRFFIPNAGILSKNNRQTRNIPRASALLYLIGMFISDGYQGQRNSINIAQSKPHICSKIEEAFDTAGLTYKKYKRKKHSAGTECIGGYVRNYQCYVYRITGISALIFKEFYLTGKLRLFPTKRKFVKKYPMLVGKNVPMWIFNLNNNRKRDLLDGLMDGDGSWNNKPANGTYYSNSKEIIDRVQMLTCLIGYRSTVNYRQRDNMYELTITNRPWNSIIHSNISSVDYNGKVWCVTTKHGSLLVRRNGKVFIAGNCGRTTRAVDDYSIVYILDKNCLRLYEKYEHEVMGWFRDSVQFVI